ncbi:pepsin-like aspartic protease [Sporobolomyces salmoneus]|uniref:pepsin-like aspartic protease n=1 Tax=Sporobolomyces salmoneus TaxID=183962 RepID=UPI00316BF6AD
MSRDRSIPPPTLSTLLYLSAALLVLISPSPVSSSPTPTPSSVPTSSTLPTTLEDAVTMHVPLYRQNGHLHALNKRLTPPSQQRELVREWAIREKGRVVNKYTLSEERLRKRQQQVQPEASNAQTRFSTAGVGATTSSGGSVATSTVSGMVSGVETTTTETRTSPQTSPTPTGPVGLVRIQNYEADLSYFAPVAIGVPPQYMSCILDTGSADLWIASTNCSSLTGCQTTTPLYNTTLSSTRLDMNTTFSVKYGGGSAMGEIWQDYVGFAGYNVSSQAFALIEDINGDLLGQGISGLMGLGWQPLAASRVTPFWQNLFAASVLPFPGFAVSLTRYNNVSTASVVEPGGSLTIGYLNASLYSSEINYVDIPSGMESYWVIPMDQVNINGTNVTSTSGGGEPQYVAIDTGTTLIGGPREVVGNLYSQVEGAQAATGRYSGYYSYPCEHDVEVTLTFGGVAYNMSSSDFNLGPFGVDSTTNRSTCLGAFFDLSFGSSSKVSWVIGASFLKNVYSVYRASPPSVGFATLSNSTRHPSSGSSSGSASGGAGDNGNITAIPGLYGPSGTVSVRTTLVPANTITTAVMAGETFGRTSSAIHSTTTSMVSVIAGLLTMVWFGFS